MRFFVRVLYFYGQREVLKDVEIEVRRGELLVIIGLNGVGKLIFFKFFVGILKLIGKVELDGRDIFIFKLVERVKLIMYVFQSFFLEFVFIVEEFVEMGSYMIGGSVEDVFRKVGFWERRRDRIMVFSGGEFQFVLIVRVLVQGSRVVFFDEFMSYFDVNYVLMVMEFFCELKMERIIIVVFYDVNLVFEYVDRFVVMKDGEKFWEGKLGEIMFDVFERVYGIRVKIVEVDFYRVFILELVKV